MSTNRIGGDFDYEALEAFRNAYANQLVDPSEHDIDPHTGLPTENISNVSPWVAHTGLWKAHDGRSLEYQRGVLLTPPVETYNDEEDEEVVSIAEELEDHEGIDEMTIEEIDSLIDELLDERYG